MLTDYENPWKKVIEKAALCGFIFEQVACCPIFLSKFRLFDLARGIPWHMAEYNASWPSVSR